jgi:hypothetical protein
MASLNITSHDGKFVKYHDEVQSDIIKDCAFEIDLPKHRYSGKGVVILTQFRVIFMNKDKLSQLTDINDRTI